MSVHLEARLDGDSGYSRAMRAVVSEWERLGRDFTLAPVTGDRSTRLRHMPDMGQVWFYAGPILALQDFHAVFTMWEMEPVPSYLLRLIRGRAVAVPSVYNVRTAKDVGIDAVRVPLGVDANLFKPSTLPRDGSTYTFLTVAQWTERKGLDLLLLAFDLAFRGRDDVRLVIKGPDRVHGSVPERVRKLLFDGLAKNVEVLPGRFNDQEMADLYRRSDCFVLPTRGEGFCLPALEAMATGLPVIITDYGGQTDFCDGSVGTVLRTKTVPVPIVMSRGESMVWGECDVSELADTMRRYAQETDRGRRQGLRGRARAMEYTWERTATEMWDWLCGVEVL